MLLRERKTQSVEIAGEGETKYRFTFTRFSAIERQRHILKEDVGKRYASEQTGVSVDAFYALIRKYATNTIERSEVAICDTFLASIAWARITCGLTLFELFDGQSWTPESIPDEWSTPEGFLSSFESFRDIFELDEVAVKLNRDFLGLQVVNEEEKKKEDLNIQPSEEISTSLPAPSTTKMRRKYQKKNQKA